MRKPSVKTLTERLRVTKEQAVYIRRLMSNDVDDDDLPERTRAWIRQGYGRPRPGDIAMHAIDCVLETHGVEAVWYDDYDEPAFEYCNTGYTYVATIVRHESGRYEVTSLGDVVEAHPERYR